jgi:hypothetical protein
MQESVRSGEKQSYLSNPLLDLAVAGLEAQLKAWQAYQVEGTRFVARRMRANLEHLRALGHCCTPEATGECQRQWFTEAQKDYTEEWSRLLATSFALSFGEVSGLGWMFGQRKPKSSPQNAPQAGGTKPRSPLSEAA